ncbi:sigma 54-interacting transcriptional regulator [Noviherbaspirillum sp. Root189]|uniref:sigma 54-interacting transcriptional regulator n=1 Tax=Noviherbaspirillum sp. Root189 TaxID=1736487 RepID=UPI00070C2C59|nr:sigma 54-interacting transcriptional regulator [Noviherbaspirillum sp. Root189]KRB90470.1 Fis family transcriptional regulator [Noviherbaspirillum sp. Root189]
MRIDVQFADRVGIAHEILAVLARRNMNVVAVEVDSSDVFIDIPELTPDLLPPLREDFMQVAGVGGVDVVDVLPGARRRLHLDTLMAVMADPVMAVDASGSIVAANAAAAAVAHLPENDLHGRTLQALFGEASLHAELVNGKFNALAREVRLHGEPFLLEATPVSEPVDSSLGQTVGGVITLHAPRRLGGRLHALQHAGGGFDSIIGESEAIRALKARGARVATVDAPLLITGETGTGKELVAQACHAASPRANAPFLALNCAALPESLAESELFGYMSGAFTGAERGGKPGLIEMAEGGSVFLDEIGEMSLYLQAKLLRFLNDGKFRRIGSDREIKVNVRIISATHRNLRKMVAEGAFREDLFYRLNVLQLEMPALRERPDDILLLARHFIERACTQAQKPICRLNPQACAALVANSWPGNVRQLQNVVFRAITMTDKRMLDVSDLDLPDPHSKLGLMGLTGDVVPAEDWEHSMAGFERMLLQKLYPQFPSSRKLAQRLKTSHSMIANKLRKYGIPGHRGD